MMTAQVVADQAEYTSELIDIALKQWDDLEARAERVKSPSAYDVARPVPTRGQGASTSALELRADIMRAHAFLPMDGLAWRVIERRKGGASLGAIARAIGVRKEDVCCAWRVALERMVEYLNGAMPQAVG